MPILPITTGKGRRETISVGPIGILVMVCFVYPMILAVQLAVVLAVFVVRLAVMLAVAGGRAIQRRHEARHRITP